MKEIADGINLNYSHLPRNYTAHNQIWGLIPRLNPVAVNLVQETEVRP